MRLNPGLISQNCQSRGGTKPHSGCHHYSVEGLRKPFITRWVLQASLGVSDHDHSSQARAELAVYLSFTSCICYCSKRPTLLSMSTLLQLSFCRLHLLQKYLPSQKRSIKRGTRPQSLYIIQEGNLVIGNENDIQCRKKVHSTSPAKQSHAVSLLLIA